MRTKKVEQFVKHSIVYGYAVTQPFLLHIHSTPLLDDYHLSEGLYEENSDIVRHIPQYSEVTDDKTEDSTSLYLLPKQQVNKGVQSSQQIEVTEKQDQDKMKKNLSKEKQADFKTLQAELNHITYNDTGKQVEQVQEMLEYHGYYDGEIDGIYGPLTEKALNQAKQDDVLTQQLQEDNSEKGASPESSNETKKDNEVDETAEQAKETVQLNVSSPTDIIQEAKQFLGTPYEWGGTSPAGFDCSGFIQYVYDQEDTILPRTVREIWNYGTETDSPSVGDLVFFETYQAGPSHLGIYLGNGEFIHAGTSSGVTVSNYHDNPYWEDKYIGAKSID